MKEKIIQLIALINVLDMTRKEVNGCIRIESDCKEVQLFESGITAKDVADMFGEECSYTDAEPYIKESVELNSVTLITLRGKEYAETIKKNGRPTED